MTATENTSRTEAELTARINWNTMRRIIQSDLDIYTRIAERGDMQSEFTQTRMEGMQEACRRLLKSMDTLEGLA